MICYERGCLDTNLVSDCKLWLVSLRLPTSCRMLFCYLLVHVLHLPCFPLFTNCSVHNERVILLPLQPFVLQLDFNSTILDCSYWQKSIVSSRVIFVAFLALQPHGTRLQGPSCQRFPFTVMQMSLHGILLLLWCISRGGASCFPPFIFIKLRSWQHFANQMHHWTPLWTPVKRSCALVLT